MVKNKKIDNCIKSLMKNSEFIKNIRLVRKMQSIFLIKSTTDHIRFCKAKSNRSRRILYDFNKSNIKVY